MTEQERVPAPRAFWADYLPQKVGDYRFPKGSLVLDIGCGPGNQLLELRASGHRVVGLEPWREVFSTLRARELPFAAGLAEQLPFRSAGIDGLLCKVVTPLTEERQSIGEMGRVLRPGGTAYVIHHGAGFYVRYLVRPETWRHRFYAARVLVNTWFYALSGARLPGWWGDTLYQSVRRLTRAYRRASLVLEERQESPRFLGLRVFIADRLRRV